MSQRENLIKWNAKLIKSKLEVKNRKRKIYVMFSDSFGVKKKASKEKNKSNIKISLKNFFFVIYFMSLTSIQKFD